MATTSTPSKSSAGSRHARRPNTGRLRRPATPAPRTAPAPATRSAPTPAPSPSAADVIPVEARLKRVEARLAALELKRPIAQGADLSALAKQLVDQAVGPVLKAIDKAIDERVARLVQTDAALAQVKAQVDAFLAARAASGEDGLYRHERFVALAREVKALKGALERPAADSALRALLNSDELKRALDERIRCLKDYLVEEVVPRALRAR